MLCPYRCGREDAAGLKSLRANPLQRAVGRFAKRRL